VSGAALAAASAAPDTAAPLPATPEGNDPQHLPLI